MKQLVPCVLLLALIACVYSAPGGGDTGEDHGAGLKEVDNVDELVRVDRSPAGGGGGCPCCYPGGDCSNGYGFEDVENGDALVRVARYPAGGGDHGEDDGAGFKEVENGYVHVRVARSPVGSGETEEDDGAGFEEVDNDDELVLLASPTAGGRDYGEYIDGGNAGDSLEYVPVDADSVSVDTILLR